MNSKHILGLIACAFLLIGCVGSLQTKSPANIGFMPVVGHDTRAEESIPFPQNRSFKLWAQEETSGSLYISNETISYNDGWFAPKPWGIEPLRFHAVWPTDLDLSYSNENGLLIDSYDCSDGDIDILYATTTADNRSESLVTLNFEHLLSRVEFRMIHSLQESMSVMIHKITLSGVAQEGTFGAVNAGEWGALEKYDSYIVFDDPDGVLIHSDVTTYLGDEFYTIPQLINGRVEVECKIKYGSAQWIPQTYVIDPIEIVWDPGKHFIYTLNIRLDKMVHTLGISSMNNRQ